MFLFQHSNGKTYPIIIKKNPRAKKIILKRSLTQELILTLPTKMHKEASFIFNFLKKSEDWIIKTERQALVPPHSIHLKAMGESEIWQILYPMTGQEKPKLSVYLDRKEIALEACADIKDIATLVQKFILQKAKIFLFERFTYLYKEYKFPQNNENNLKANLKIRALKSRWGSYSSKGVLSLNSRLMLLPLHLVDYVIVHELCHVSELNHSPKFYALLEEKMPNYKKYEQEIKANKLNPFLWI